MTQSSLRFNGPEMRRRRVDMGLSQPQLAGKMALATNTVAKPKAAIAAYESGVYAPGCITHTAIAAALGCKMEDLMTVVAVD